jgi:hypothetical protein
VKTVGNMEEKREENLTESGKKEGKFHLTTQPYNSDIFFAKILAVITNSFNKTFLQIRTRFDRFLPYMIF